MKSMLRLRAAWERIGVGHTKFFQDFVERPGGDPFIPDTKVPRLRLVPIGKRGKLAVSDEIDALITALAAERDAEFADGPHETAHQIQARKGSEAAARKRAEGHRRKRHGSLPESKEKQA